MRGGVGLDGTSSVALFGFGEDFTIVSKTLFLTGFAEIAGGGDILRVVLLNTRGCVVTPGRDDVSGDGPSVMSRAFRVKRR